MNQQSGGGAAWGGYLTNFLLMVIATCLVAIALRGGGGGPGGGGDRSATESVTTPGPGAAISVGNGKISAWRIERDPADPRGAKLRLVDQQPLP